MIRRISLTLTVAALAATTAIAGTSGFQSTFEETGFTYPPLNTPINYSFPAPIGTFVVMSNDNIVLTDLDPVRGSLPCDPTTLRALILDATTTSAHLRYEFPMAARGMIVLDRAVLGAETGDSFGMEWGVYSAITRREETVFQFGPNDQVLVYGRPVDIGGGQFLTYQNLWANDCAAGIDNHFTVTAIHDLVGGTVRVEILTHGNGATSYQLGPFASNPETNSEGIRGMFSRAPGGTGRFYNDKMVCNGSAPVIVPPTGDSPSGGSRRRY